MRKKYFTACIVFLTFILLSCGRSMKEDRSASNIRQLIDTVGFAQYCWQMDSVMARIVRQGWEQDVAEPWKTVICPHDDYTYVGRLYPELLQNIKADNLILIGVAHKAAQLGIEDSLVFDSHTHWKGPWGDVPVSGIREDIFSRLQNSFAIISDTMQNVEHSLESLIPFLQYFNHDISIVPILVPAMSLGRMEQCGKALAGAIMEVASENGWTWGKDYAIVATTDAVHYGNEDWGGEDRAPFGCDDAGNEKARGLEAEIISNCLEGSVSPEEFRRFSAYTIQSGDFHEYKWTWCGRYSVPVALYTSYYLNDSQAIEGSFVGYSTSITNRHIPIDDLRMGRTAIATKCHWVGYAALGYR